LPLELGFTTITLTLDSPFARIASPITNRQFFKFIIQGKNNKPKRRF